MLNHLVLLAASLLVLALGMDNTQSTDTSLTATGIALPLDEKQKASAYVSNSIRDLQSPTSTWQGQKGQGLEKLLTATIKSFIDTRPDKNAVAGDGTGAGSASSLPSLTRNQYIFTVRAYTTHTRSSRGSAHRIIDPPFCFGENRVTGNG